MTFLETIVEKKLEDISELKQTVGLNALKNMAEQRVLHAFPFEQALSQSELTLIAEVKKASPSKGVIREVFEPVDIARSFEVQGASALSVLTERHFFLGASDYLTQISDHVALPILRKDFILEPIQVYETVAIGAHAMLLIVAMLSQDQLSELYHLGRSLGLSVLVELHDESELPFLDELTELSLVGINNRNLKTFHTDLDTVPTLMKQLRARGYMGSIVAESGYQHAHELDQLTADGVSAVLIGEGLARVPELAGYFGRLS